MKLYRMFAPGIEALSLCEEDVPRPGPGQALVRAAGHFGKIVIRHD